MATLVTVNGDQVEVKWKRKGCGQMGVLVLSVNTGIAKDKIKCNPGFVPARSRAAAEAACGAPKYDSR